MPEDSSSDETVTPLAAGGFPQEWVIGTPEYEARLAAEAAEYARQQAELERSYAEQQKLTPPKGLAPSEEEEWLRREQTPGEENATDRLDRETAWHHLANPDKPLTPRHIEFCRLLAIGKAHYMIHDILGYSRVYISVLSSHVKVRKTVREMQDTIFQSTIADRIKGANHKAFDVLEEIIMTENSQEIKPQLRADVAKWIIEKSTGKAGQSVEVKGGGLTTFMDLLKQYKEEASNSPSPKGEAMLEPQTIDVTPLTPPAEKDEIASWIDSNL